MSAPRLPMRKIREVPDGSSLPSSVYRGGKLTIRDRPPPAFAEIHRELARTGVTLQLLWEEYAQVHLATASSACCTGNGPAGSARRCARCIAPARRPSSTSPASDRRSSTGIPARSGRSSCLWPCSAPAATPTPKRRRRSNSRTGWARIACRRGFSARYVRMPRLLHEVRGRARRWLLHTVADPVGQTRPPGHRRLVTRAVWTRSDATWSRSSKIVPSARRRSSPVTPGPRLARGHWGSESSRRDL